MAVLEQCRWCNKWNWEQDTCGLSTECLNHVVRKEPPTWFRDVREVMQEDWLKEKEKHGKSGSYPARETGIDSEAVVRAASG